MRTQPSGCTCSSACDSSSTRPRHGCCVRHRFSLERSRDVNFCVATWLGWDRLVLGRDMIFHVATGAAAGALRHGNCKGAEVGSRHTFWCHDMEQVTQCCDTILGVTTHFWCHDMVWLAWGRNLNLVSRPSLGMAGGSGVVTWDWCCDKARLWAVSQPVRVQRVATWLPACGVQRQCVPACIVCTQCRSPVHTTHLLQCTMLCTVWVTMWNIIHKPLFKKKKGVQFFFFFCDLIYRMFILHYL